PSTRIRLRRPSGMPSPLWLRSNDVMPHSGCPAACVKAAFGLLSMLEYVHSRSSQVPASHTATPNAARAGPGVHAASAAASRAQRDMRAGRLMFDGRDVPIDPHTLHRRGNTCRSPRSTDLLGRLGRGL